MTETITNNSILYKSYEETISEVLNNNQDYKAIVQVVSMYKDESLWIGGGFIRSIIWDYLSSHKITSEFGDIDVFYYNIEDYTKERDSRIEAFLLSIAPNINWSVKNQARMHVHNNEPQYISLLDALNKFPDTASTITIRKKDEKDYIFLAPFGYIDLFNLKIRATPHFMSSEEKMNRYYERISNKKWIQKWPKLSLIF